MSALNDNWRSRLRNWPSSKRPRHTHGEAPEMKFCLHRKSSGSIKAMCRVLHAASGWYVWLRRRHRSEPAPTVSAHLRCRCPWRSLRQSSDTVLPALLTNCRSSILNPLQASLRRQGLGRKPAGSSDRSAPCTWPARIGESAGAGLQRQRPEPEVGG